MTGRSNIGGIFSALSQRDIATLSDIADRNLDFLEVELEDGDILGFRDLDLHGMLDFAAVVSGDMREPIRITDPEDAARASQDRRDRAIAARLVAKIISWAKRHDGGLVYPARTEDDQRPQVGHRIYGYKGQV